MQTYRSVLMLWTRINRIALVAAIAGALLLFALPVLFGHARDNGQWAQVNPEIGEWIKGLHNKQGNLCCFDADGFDVQWDIHDGHYRAFIKPAGWEQGEWVEVPDDAKLDIPNRLGVARVWYWIDNDIDGVSHIRIRCFLPGTQG